MAETKAQSAMEYLMTYGWAILIIAVVLGALFELGFFNSSALAPKVGPGSCQVYRPEGPGTIAFESLAGTCNNELPQYVASFNSLRFGSISTGQSGLPVGASSRSVFAWVYFDGNYTGPNPTSSYSMVFSYGTPYKPNQDGMSQLGIDQGLVYFDGFANDAYATNTVAILYGSWHFIGYTYSYNSPDVTLYIDNQEEPVPLSLNEPLNTSLLYSNIGYYQGYMYPWYYQGYVSNIQVYNTSLSPGEVTALYDEGIGGAPIDLSNLVAWWPLNGNANDYSGNQNNGVPYNVLFTTSWTYRYTAP